MKKENKMKKVTQTDMDELLEFGLFALGDEVHVVANKDDIFNDFCGTVIGYSRAGVVLVKDQNDNVWDVGENQCWKA